MKEEGDREILKMADFGLSKFLVPNDTLNICAGTKSAYMAPQVFAGSAYTHKADVWSLGVLLLEIITRNVKGLLPENTTKFTNLEPSDIESHAPLTNPVIFSIVEFICSKMVVKDEGQRQSIAEIISEFEVF